MLLMKNVTPPESVVHHKEENTHVFIEQKDCGNGTLYISENCVCWISSTEEGISFEYPSICLHAISRDTTAFSQECIYMQISLKLIEDEEPIQDEVEDGDDSGSDEGVSIPQEDIDPCTSVRLVPSNSDSLAAIYSALSLCQALHPDPDDSDEGTEFFNSPADEENMTPEGLITLQRLEAMMQRGDSTLITAAAAGMDGVNGTVNEQGDGDEEDMEAEEVPEQ